MNNIFCFNNKVTPTTEDGQPLLRPQLQVFSLFAALLLGLLLVGATPLGKLDIDDGIFLAFHTFAEIMAVVVSLLIFAVAWPTPDRSHTRGLLLLGAAFLAVALIDIGHLLSYQGMPDFVTPSSPPKAIAFWLAARLIEASALLAAVLLRWQPSEWRGERHLMLSAALLLPLGVYSVVLFHFEWLPSLFVPGLGLTPLKVNLEYTVIAMLTLTAGIQLYRVFVRHDHTALYLLMAVVTMAGSEIFFTLYTSVTDMASLFGHLYKVVACLFLYRAVFVENVQMPFRRLQESEAHFRKLMEVAPDGILIADAQGRIVAINNQAEHMFEYLREELIGKPIEVLIPQRFRADHVGRSRGFLGDPGTERTISGAEVVALHRNGTEFPVELSLSSLATREGNLAICVVRDITQRKAAEQTLLQRDQELRALTDDAPDIISRFDPQLRRIYVNHAITKVDGKPREFYLDKTFRELGKPDEFAELWESRLKEVFDSGKECEFEFHYDSTKGRRHYYAHLTPEFSVDGTVAHVIAVAPDITARVMAEEENKRLASIMEAAPDLVGITDTRYRFVYLNPAGRHMLGMGYHEDPAWLDPSHYYPGWAARRMREEAVPEALNRGVWRGESAILRRGGEEVPVMQTLIPHRDKHGEVLYWSNIIQDFSELRKLEQQLSHQATHDQLTGFPNRTLMLDRLRQSIAHAERSDRVVAVLLLDLDDFKNINDALGHAFGDELLRHVGQRLSTCLRGGDTFGRLGGDEFAVLLEDMAQMEDVLPIVEKLQYALSQPFTVQAYDLSVNASIGITFYPNDDLEAENLLRNADIAMYEAKNRGRNTYCFYKTDMNSNVKERLELLEQLRRAVVNEEFVLYYQPKVNLVSGEVCGMEALIRWQHPEMGMIPPNDFIPLAEDSGLILEIGAWVLRTACFQNRAWQNAGLPPLRVAVNLSARQFKQEGLIRQISAALRESGLDAAFLELEITESMVMDSAEHSLAVLHALKDTGVALSIDDFGTGYSSLSYLQRFPVNFLKIDRSFVINAPSDPNDAAIAGAIISMAHQLGLQVIAEGVETEQHVEFLCQHQCDEMQGYFFSKPLPAAEFEKLLRNGRRLDVQACNLLRHDQVHLVVDNAPATESMTARAGTI